jgi:very-short-patch-repair endonuclease
MTAEDPENWMQGGLEELRKRLLDLTRRNKLLNFRHGKSSLRVVDELPDELFKRLKNGTSLIFRPVPEPPRGRSVSPSKEANTLPMKIITSPEEKSEQSGRKVSATEYAKQLGIRTSYDLPQAGEEHNPNHFDTGIQTLHYPDDLEAILRKIGASARTAIEESGTNMLYLIFGFLEWYESHDSNDPVYSPLVTLPIELTKDKPSRKFGGMFEFSVEGTGEDLLTNLSLVERMKRDFAINIPLLDEEDTPESYFAKFADILAIQPRWRIRRQITLALLHFGKLLMFLDLDSSRNATLQSNPRVKEILGETSATEDGLSYGEIYELDHPSICHELPPLIYDADSSQHSALVDVFRGKNIVIEGPPGTGKSQTITNIIASSLVQGKTVLFVSEKLAALEVVRRRMDQAGLGHFCLELHSHKTKKDKLLHDIQQRIARQRSFQDPDALETKIQILERHKTELTQYVQTINQPFGAMGKSIFSILWTRDNCLQRSPFLKELADRLTLENADQISSMEREHQLLLVNIYQDHIASLLERVRTLCDQPWFGVTNPDLTYVQEGEAVEKVERLKATVNNLINQTRSMFEMIKAEPAGSISQLQYLTKAVNALPLPKGTEWLSVLSGFAKSEARQQITEYLVSLASWKEEGESLRKVFSRIPSLNEFERVELVSLFNDLRSYDLRKQNLADIILLSSSVRTLGEKLSQLIMLSEKVAESLGVCIVFTWATLPLLAQVTTIIKNADFEVLNFRHSILSDPTNDETRDKIREEAQVLRKLKKKLSQEFVLSRLPTSDELWKHATVISTSSWLTRLFGKEYKAALNLYRSLRRVDGKVRWQVMASDLKELAEYLESLRNFTTHQQHKEMFGPAFIGIETPFEKLESLKRWYENVRTRFAPYHEAGAIIAEALRTSSIETLRLIQAMTQNSSAAMNQVDEMLSSVKRLPFINSESLQDMASLSSFRDEMAAVEVLLQRAVANLSHIPFCEGVILDEMPALLVRANRFRNEEQKLNKDSNVSSLLGKHFQGCSTENNRVEDTLNVVEQICHESISNDLRVWLLTPEYPARVAQLKERVLEISCQITKLSDLWKEFTELVRLDEKKWYSEAGGDWRDYNIALINGRLDRAIQAPSDLSSWLDYLRSRRALEDVHLHALIFQAEAGQLRPSHLLNAYNFALFNGLCNLVLKAHPRLLNFSRSRHEKIRDEFAKLDTEIQSLYRKKAAYIISRRNVPRGTGNGPVREFTDLSLLEHEIQKQRGHISIRSLLNRANKALLALKPCFMMGPMSVAQYLIPGKFHFDRVVMDEASQLKPEDAVGALARGSQVIIVGDPKQLPPTTFFDTMFIESDETEEEQDNLAIEESESILDRACEVYKPIRQLRWHYRSRHESLIAFSNRRFYDQNLILFPSPSASTPDLGVKYNYLANGVYSGRTNRHEADQVVHAVLEHMRIRQEESLGVATFNTTQRDLIEELLDGQLKKDHEAQSYISKWKDSAEPFFIKNLETVQGDERDCIIISFTYGRDDKGNIFQRFGPINGTNGHRRLNVLFTRAKLRTEVFTSMQPEDIRVGEDASLGLKAMRAYLVYAKTGVLDQAIEGEGPEPNEFELAVGSELKNCGFDTVHQVGVAGYFIDLAVRHPKKDGCYILGIECDGATYHSAKSARDRDRLRQTNLENLGWCIHRVWSTDWLKARHAEIERIAQRIHKILRGEELNTTS